MNSLLFEYWANNSDENNNRIILMIKTFLEIIL